MSSRCEDNAQYVIGSNNSIRRELNASTASDKMELINKYREWRERGLSKPVHVYFIELLAYKVRRNVKYISMSLI